VVESCLNALGELERHYRATLARLTRGNGAGERRCPLWGNRQYDLPEVFRRQAGGPWRRRPAQRSKSGEAGRPRSRVLSQDVARRGPPAILHGRAPFTPPQEAEGPLHVERRSLRARVLQNMKVAQCPRRRSVPTPRRRSPGRLGMARINFSRAFSISLCDQVGRPSPRDLAAGHFDVRPLSCLPQTARCQAPPGARERAPFRRRS